MKVFIKETQEVKELSIVDENGIDWTGDFINVSVRDEFSFNDDEGYYETDLESYEWWERIIEEHQKLNDRIHELKEEHGYDAVYEVIKDAYEVDLEDQPASVHAALDEVFGEE